jgi:alkylation response protein AidB-like acyl-CoA dehydrogenase
MTAKDISRIYQLAEDIAAEFALSAVERDKKGGTAKRERDRLRQSGLLRLIIPQEYGGHGLNWFETLKVIRIIARADSALAHLFGFQHLLLATVRLFGDQWPELYRKTARDNLFWGNTLNPLDPRATVVKSGSAWLLSGTKGWCSGARDSDYLVVSALDGESKKFVVAAIPSDREGIHIHDDWDNMGQRQTDSGSVEFHNVVIQDHEFLRAPGPLGNVYATLRSLIAQLVLINIYIGIGEGALAEARKYTESQSKAWFLSGVDKASDDPYVLQKYGEFWVELNGAVLAADHAATLLDGAWAKGEVLTERERGHLALATSTAKVLATRASLDVTHRLFEVTGPRATSAQVGFDRFWRNLRTHTLHDPLDYKLKDIGEWVLNEHFPKPTFYS